MDIITDLKKIMNKLINDPVKAFLPFVLAVLVITVILVLISACLSFIMLFSFNCLSNQNCTPANITSFINQNSSGLIGIFTNSLLTTGLIIFSALSVYSTHRTLKQSQKEQQIRSIENKLEKFYCPLSQRLGDYHSTCDHNTFNDYETLLKETSSYVYLAIKKDVKDKFEELRVSQRNPFKGCNDLDEIDQLINELLILVNRDIEKLENRLEDLNQY